MDYGARSRHCSRAMAPPRDPQPALGAAIRKLRQQRKLSQEDLAHDAGLTTSALSSIERGKSNPTWATVRRIAAALGVSMSKLAQLAER
jgi:transcriptional regulator with XRE-family HTH domain